MPTPRNLRLTMTTYRLSGQAEEDIINLYIDGALQFGIP